MLRKRILAAGIALTLALIAITDGPATQYTPQPTQTADPCSNQTVGYHMNHCMHNYPDIQVKTGDRGDGMQEISICDSQARVLHVTYVWIALSTRHVESILGKDTYEFTPDIACITRVIAPDNKPTIDPIDHAGWIVDVQIWSEQYAPLVLEDQ